MATSPQPHHLDETLDAPAPDAEGLYNPRPGHTLPGHTVDALLAQGNIEEARAELERLIEEGIDSGISPEPPQEMMNRLRARLQERAAAV